MMNIFEEAYRGIQEAKKAYAAATNTALKPSPSLPPGAAQLKPHGFSRKPDAPWLA